ncbi:acylneuraminate cytidylyltransferase family protein [archaeon]|jgi:CMP-N,N'-diacetyllegionaminic acid synthase|nr:acylneuraminate cytidylyltransferase family protein [archaeon]MBT4352479.1 acylneuraminate cytidylyltransferase family protein [archaeon]MBT4647064.1 acylneuraminate cytidylyltransferase family protein [archaeon]MBT6820973.1 acylneuraminate cytidylyltransferase family protein [archaeon]MBT7392704.1 acylneuraminate cytidylyltransferase family protein [archaeon]
MKMYKGKKIISIIPARGGSKRIPRKNVIDLCGKPLIAYSIEQSLQSKYIDETYVSTEDAEIKEVSLKFGAKIIDRPIKLAQDESKSIDVMKHALEYLENNNNAPGIVILLQPTSPLRLVEDVDKAIETFMEKDADTLESLSECLEHPSYMFKKGIKYMIPLDKKGLEKTRIELPQYYVENGSIFILKYLFIKNEKTFYSNKHTGFILPRERSIDIDNEIDLKIAKLILEKRKK